MKNLKLILKSLISNDACITGGRKRKWYLAIPLVLLSIIFSLIPMFVTTMTTEGDNMFSSYSYGAAEASYGFIEDMTAKNVDLIVEKDEDGKNVLKTSGDWTVAYPNVTVEDITYPGSYDHYLTHEDGVTKTVDYRFYYIGEFSADVLSNILNRDESKVSLVVFAKNNLTIYVVNPIDGKQINSMNCTNSYEKFSEGYSIKSLLVEENIGKTWSNWKNMFVKAYEYTKVTQAWTSTGIMAAIDVVVVALMGFMVWILTRGKNNPFRIYTFWESQKIAYWAALCPGILAIPLGFLITKFLNIWFPLLLGVRVMWLCTKQLKPDGQGYVEPKEEVKTVKAKPVK